jgi:hypothetical protein
MYIYACTIGETDLEVANIFTDFEASGEHFVEAADQRVSRRQNNHLSSKRGHPRLKHPPWSNGKQGPKGSVNNYFF